MKNISTLGKLSFQLYFKVSHEEFDKRIDLDGLDTDSENDEVWHLKNVNKRGFVVMDFVNQYGF